MASRIRTTSARSCGPLMPRARPASCARVVGRRRSTARPRRRRPGAVHHVAVADVVNIARAVEELKEAGVWTVGLDADAKTTYYELDLTVPTALVLGAEGHGLRRLVRERCDFVAAIPMAGHVGSLNVSAAAAVVLFEAVRQRRRGDRPAARRFWRLGIMGFPRSASTRAGERRRGRQGSPTPRPGFNRPGGPNAVDPGGGPFGIRAVEARPSGLHGWHGTCYHSTFCLAGVAQLGRAADL